MLELLINKQSDKTTIMLVQAGILLERHEEYTNRKRLEGNIYNGKVQNVVQGMESAFVDIGDSRNTFIRIKDILPKVDETKKDSNSNEEKSINIKDIVKAGEYITVQVKKDGTDRKGARVSTHINLSGRFAVFLPNSDFVTVSQKIEDEKEKQRLIKAVESILPKNTGAIIRTSAEGMDENSVIKDMEVLIKKWEDIKGKTCLEGQVTPKEPELLYDNRALLRRTVIDVIDQGLNKIIVNDKTIYEDVIEIIKDMLMDKKIEIVLKEKEDLLQLYEMETQIEKIENRRIWLKSGGFITIDRTEALTAIDVNTGKFVGTKNLEQTVFEVNKEATEEIAKQLRLRDIGGIIIIDYIDMHDKENEQKILELLVKCLKKDRMKCQVVGFTKLNLLEMTRKNICNNESH
ncbi:MAG: Rne/Rng family ribonuclease [Oscillospiraceae bacterium]|nr:Rne/Rng family ribonuclease [Oscillospiraceae bacterium]